MTSFGLMQTVWAVSDLSMLRSNNQQISLGKSKSLFCSSSLILCTVFGTQQKTIKAVLRAATDYIALTDKEVAIGLT